MTATRLVALDLGTISACVIAEPARPLIVAEWDCSVRRGESNGMRFLRFRRLLGEVLDSRQRTVVAYEHPGGHLRNGAAAEVLLGLVAEVQAECTARSVECCHFNPSSVKRAAVGKGGGKGTTKEFILAAARERWPELRVESEHVADALFVLELARKEIG